MGLSAGVRPVVPTVARGLLTVPTQTNKAMRNHGKATRLKSAVPKPDSGYPRLASVMLLTALMLAGQASPAPYVLGSGDTSVDLALGRPVPTPAEYEPVQAVALKWLFDTNSNDLYAFLVKHILLAGATPIIITQDGQQAAGITACLRCRGVDPQDVSILQLETDTSWIRDYGAVGVFRQGPDALTFADFGYKADERPLDDRTPFLFCRAFGAEVYTVRSRSHALVLEGGDFLTDGFGTIFTSLNVARANGTRQATQALSNDLAATAVHFLPTLRSLIPTHIDMHVKLLDEETVVIGDTLGPDEDPVLNATARYFSLIPTCYGTPYRIFRVPYYEGVGPEREQILYSYTNALIVNNYVLVPLYGNPADAYALDTYEEAMPGYHVEGYDCTSPIIAGGAIHCITREIPAESVLRLAHARFQRSFRTGDTITFRATCWPHEEGTRLWLHYQLPDGKGMRWLKMDREGAGFVAELTTVTPGEIRYYIRARAGALEGYKPQNGFDGGYLTIQVTR